MSDSVQPRRRQPTRLLCLWDSPGKSTGVGCHFLLQCMKVKSESEIVQSCPTLSDPVDCSLPGSSIHGIFQARGLERGAIAFSSKTPGRCQTLGKQQGDCSPALSQASGGRPTESTHSSPKKSRRNEAGNQRRKGLNTVLWLNTILFKAKQTCLFPLCMHAKSLQSRPTLL